MNFRRIISGLGVASLIIAGSTYFSSCTPMITEEQKMQLNELRNKEKSLTEAIQQKKSDKSKLESELSSRQSELKKCTDEKDYITKKVGAWPNIWPDWKPPVPEAAPEQK